MITWKRPDKLGIEVSAAVTGLAYAGQNVVTAKVEIWTGYMGQLIYSDLALKISAGDAPGLIARAIRPFLSPVFGPDSDAGIDRIALEATKKPLTLFLDAGELWTQVRTVDNDLPYQPDWLVYPLVAADGVSILFGAPGTGKSLLACGAGLVAATGAGVCGLELDGGETKRSLYVDFESTERAWRKRTDGLAESLDLDTGPGLDTHYLHLDGHIAQYADALRRLVEAGLYGLVIVDSAGRITGDATTPGDTTAALAVLNSLGVPVLLIAHSPKANATTVYGSRFWEAGARLVTRVDAGEHESNRMVHSFQTTKANDVPFAKPTTVDYTWTATGAIIAEAKAGAIAKPPEGADLILDHLDAGPATLKEISEVCQFSDASARRHLAGLLKIHRIKELGRNGHAKTYALPDFETGQITQPAH